MTAQPQGKAPMAEHGPSRPPALMAELSASPRRVLFLSSTRSPWFESQDAAEHFRVALS